MNLSKLKKKIENKRDSKYLVWKCLVLLKDMLWRIKYSLSFLNGFWARREAIRSLKNKYKSEDFSVNSHTNQKVAFFTALTDDFIPGFKVMVRSLLHTNPQVDFDYIVLDLGLSEKSKEVCRDVYPKIIFYKPKYNNYEDTQFDNLKNHHHQKIYYKLDLFRLSGYDRIISIDADMVIFDDISYLWSQDIGKIAAVGNYSKKEGDMSGFNAGLMSVHKSLLGEDNWYPKIISKTHKKAYHIAEQGVLNDIFRDKVVFLPRKFNCKKDLFYSSRKKRDCNLSEIKVLHYTVEKPWEKSISWEQLYFHKLNKLWFFIKNETSHE